MLLSNYGQDGSEEAETKKQQEKEKKGKPGRKGQSQPAEGKRTSLCDDQVPAVMKRPHFLKIRRMMRMSPTNRGTTALIMAWMPSEKNKPPTTEKDLFGDTSDEEK
jgi:hypothetical protein